MRYLIATILIASLLVGCANNTGASIPPSPTATAQGLQVIITPPNNDKEQQTTTKAVYDRMLHATVQPEPTFLTMREAFNHTALREQSRQWADDSVLVDVGLGYPDELYDLAEYAANDGTSRQWIFTFASASRAMFWIVLVRDGVIRVTYSDEQDYRNRYIGERPIDLPLEQDALLDSDQARYLFLHRFEQEWNTLDDFHLFHVSTLPDPKLPTASVYWLIADRFGNRSVLDAQTGQTVVSSFKEVDDAIAFPQKVAPVATARPFLPEPTQTLNLTQAQQDAFFRQQLNLSTSTSTFRFSGLFATNGTDYWQYTKQGWRKVFPTDRRSLLRAGVPSVLIDATR